MKIEFKSDIITTINAIMTTEAPENIVSEALTTSADQFDQLVFTTPNPNNRNGVDIVTEEIFYA